MKIMDEESHKGANLDSPRFRGESVLTLIRLKLIVFLIYFC